MKVIIGFFAGLLVKIVIFHHFVPFHPTFSHFVNKFKTTECKPTGGDVSREIFNTFVFVSGQLTQQMQLLMDLATHQKQFKPINVKDLFMDKSPALAPWIPGFVYQFLSRMLRIDFMNQFLHEHGLKKNVDFARASIEVFNVTLGVKGAANHPHRGFERMVKEHAYSLADNPESEFNPPNS